MLKEIPNKSLFITKEEKNDQQAVSSSSKASSPSDCHGKLPEMFRVEDETRRSLERFITPENEIHVQSSG